MKKIVLILLSFPLLFLNSSFGGFPADIKGLEELQKQLKELENEVEEPKVKKTQFGLVKIDDVSRPWYFKMVWFDAGGYSEIYYQVNDEKPVLLGGFVGSLGELNLPPVKIPNLKEGDTVRFLVKTYWDGRWYGPVSSQDPKFFLTKKEGKRSFSFQFEDAASADNAYNDGKFLFYQGKEQEFKGGLVAHWSFDNCEAKDVTGNGYDGKIKGKPECVEGVRGKALAFNIKGESDNGCGQRGGDYISLPTFGGVWEKGITICAWAKFTQPRHFERIVDFGSGPGEEGGYPILLGRLGTGKEIVLESWINSDGNLNRNRGRLTYPAIKEGDFRFYCGVIKNLGEDKGEMAIFVDGKLLAKKVGNSVKNTVRAKNFIGHSNWCFNDPDFKGVIDEVYLFNRPLTDKEIAELYKKTKPKSEEVRSFGTSKRTPFVFEGTIYPIPKGVNSLPDFSKLKPVGKVYTPVLNITPRDFREGFPGVTDRFEWFAIDYRGKIFIPKDREFTFYLLSDDGSRLIIDGKRVIDNDGIHPPTEKEGKIKLKRGVHTVEVQYFQGPRYHVALVLSYLKNGQKVPFDIREFSPVKVEESNCQVNLTLSSAILFDFNSYALKPEAIRVLDEVIGYIKDTPYQRLIVEGHTDNKGSEDYNLKLSKKRAQTVANYLIAKGVPANKIEVIGYGEKRPKYPNTTEENRAKNRRVEIKLIKRCSR